MTSARGQRSAALKFIVMLGTALDTKGGVSSVINVYRQYGLFERWPIIYLPTHCEGSAIRKMACVARSLFKYLWLLLRGRVAIVHVHTSSRMSFWRKSLFILIAYACRKAVIFHLHGGNFDAFYASLGKMRQWLVRFVLNHACRIIVLSSQWKAWIRGVSANRHVMCIHNPVAVPENANRLEHRSRLLFLGRMNQGKGIYDLLEALGGLASARPALRLTCAGDGEAVKVAARALDLGIHERVDILGWVGADTRDRLIASSTILVLPSYFEGMPMSVLEAMAAGTPVITTPVGGIPDVIEDGVDGYMVPAGDKVALGRVLARLLADPVLQKQIGTAARNKIRERFSADVIVPQLEKLYVDLHATPVSAMSGFSAVSTARG